MTRSSASSASGSSSSRGPAACAIRAGFRRGLVAIPWRHGHRLGRDRRLAFPRCGRPYERPPNSVRRSRASAYLCADPRVSTTSSPRLRVPRLHPRHRDPLRRLRPVVKEAIGSTCKVARGRGRSDSTTEAISARGDDLPRRHRPRLAVRERRRSTSVHPGVERRAGRAESATRQRRGVFGAARSTWLGILAVFLDVVAVGRDRSPIILLHRDGINRGRQGPSRRRRSPTRRPSSSASCRTLRSWAKTLIAVRSLPAMSA